MVHLVRARLRARNLAYPLRALTTTPSLVSPQVGSLPELDSRAVKSSVKKDWRQWLGAYARVEDLLVNGRPAYRYDSADDGSTRMIWCTVSNLWQVMACVCM